MGWRHERTIMVHGRTVQVLAAGSAGAHLPVIVVGGLGSVASDWDAVIDRLGPQPHLVWFDGIRPTGRADECGQPVRATAGLIHDTARAIGLTPPWILVGHSLGGQYVQGFARLYPDLTAAVVLIDSTVPDRIPGRGRARGVLRTLGWRTARWLTVEAGGAMLFGRLARQLAVWSNTLHGPDPLPAAEADRVYRDPRQVALVLDEWWVSSTTATDLRRIAGSHPFPACPTIVLVGTCFGRPTRRRDPTWIRSQHQLATLTDTARLVEVKAAHLVMLDQPQAVATILSDLLMRA